MDTAPSRRIHDCARLWGRHALHANRQRVIGRRDEALRFERDSGLNTRNDTMCLLTTINDPGNRLYRHPATGNRVDWSRTLTRVSCESCSWPSIAAARTTIRAQTIRKRRTDVARASRQRQRQRPHGGAVVDDPARQRQGFRGAAHRQLESALALQPDDRLHRPQLCLDAPLAGKSVQRLVHLFGCDLEIFNQEWDYNDKTKRLRPLRDKSYGLDASNNSTSNASATRCRQALVCQGSRLTGTPVLRGKFAYSEPYQPNQVWTIDPVAQTVRLTDTNVCLDAYEPRDRGAVHMFDCDPNVLNQKWIYDAKTKQLQHATHKGFCLDFADKGVTPFLFTCNTIDILGLAIPKQRIQLVDLGSA
ncbi:Aste57867_20765 [Aphanomyces stellatus]|uniref:Aste57867_20765 protein n=1 Tax=Aphanomyces stellatus TaxID=120398 RepID=A0A485LFS0_9STRA|nr:hypothetical protein As57867_020697 [Aphanomyces stellatus]VFT97444.1 Aste57867_20765 [Aphanomyces stellatus]